MESSHAECGHCGSSVRRSNDNFYLIVSDLVPLIDHVQASIRLIETATAHDCAGNQEFAEIMMLDDVTPLHAQADAALGAYT